MKKTLAILMALSLVMPLTGVKAISGNYYVYGKGDQVNFYYNSDDEAKGEDTEDAGRTTIILKDEGKTSEYVKVLTTGFAESKSDIVSVNGDGFEYSSDVSAYSPVKTIINSLEKEPVTTPYVKDLTESVGFITLDELIDVFGASKNDDGTYTIDLTKKIGTDSITVKKAFQNIYDEIAPTLEAKNTALETAGSKRRFGLGFYTSTLSEDKTQIYAVKMEGKDGELTKLTVELVELPTDSTTSETQTIYSLVPTLYFNKTYDCHKHTTETTDACYLCGEEYVWTETGTQDSTCKLASKITKKADCVKPVSTGVYEYIAEFVGIVGICSIALILVKRKDLFKSI